MKTMKAITTKTTKATKAKTKETIITKANKMKAKTKETITTKANETKTKTTKPTEVYMNLLNDFGFKFIFRKKRFLIHFLNELLDGKEKIKRVQELNSERLGKTKEDRRAVFDVYCKNEKGEHILLEMQHIPQDYFLDRSIYYSSFLIQQQGKKGKWDYKLKKIYVIGILNFVPKEMRTTGDYIYRVKLCDIKTSRVISEKLNFIYVNLPKFKKSSGKLETVMDYWLHALINSQPGREIDEKVLKKDRFFAGLLNTIRVNKLNKDEMRAYRLSERDFEDMKKNMTGYISYQREDAKEEGMKLGVQVGMQQGIQQGMQKGMQQGRAEGRLEIALNALKRGYSIEEVSALTNLTSAEIDELRKLSSL